MNELDILKKVHDKIAAENLSKDITTVRFVNQDMLSGKITLPIQYCLEWTAKTDKKMQQTRTIIFFPPYNPFTGEKYETK